MHDWPHFSLMLSVGFISVIAELSLLLWTIRSRRSAQTDSTAIPVVILAAVVALIPPILAVGLTSKGRRELVQETLGSQGPRWETMTRETHQQQVLLLGTGLALPSFLVAGITMGIGPQSSRRAGFQRALRGLRVPVLVLPFLSGMWLYLYRLFSTECQGPECFSARGREPVVRGTLLAAKRALDSGALLAGLVLGAIFVGYAMHIVRTKKRVEPVRQTVLRVSLSILLMVVAASLWRLAEPLAAENRVPLPDHRRGATERIFPSIPTTSSQDDLYEMNGTARTGIYRSPLRFPLTTAKQEAMGLAGPILEVTDGGVRMDWRKLSAPADLREALQLAQSNHRQLRGDQGTGSTLIMATPNSSLDLLADVLATIYDLGDREVRLVTGLPETAYRPVLGPVSRIIVQTTTVALVRAQDLDPRRANPTISVPGKFRQYRDLLDRVLAEPHAPDLPVLLVIPGKAKQWD